MMSTQSIDQLLRQNDDLRLRLEEAEDAVRALRTGEADAVLVGAEHQQIYTLETAEQPYRLLVDQVPQGAATLTVEGVIIYCNRRFAAMLERPLHSLLGKPLGNLVARDSRPQLEALLRDGLAGEVQSEVIFQRADGMLVPVYLGVSAVREGAFGLCLMVTDLTMQRHYQELQRVQSALRESEGRLARDLAAAQRLQEISGHMISENDAGRLYDEILDAAMSIMRSDMASLQVIDESENALRMLAWRGFDPAFGTTFEPNRPDTKNSCSVAWRLGRRVVVPDVETCDYIAGTTALEDHRKTGIRAVQSTPLVSRHGKMLGMISTHWRQPHDPPEHALRLMDILARQAADLIERMREEEVRARLAAIVTTSEDAIISKDLDGIVTSWNRGAEHIFGYSPEEIVGKSVTLLIPEDHLNEEPEIAGKIRRGETVEHYETVRRRKDGSLLDISLTVSPLRDTAGRVVGASKIARDITEQKRAARALQRHAAQFETLLNEVPLGVYLVDGDFRIRHMSPATRPVFGAIPDLIGRDFDEVIHILWPESYADEIVQRFRHTLETGEPYIAHERAEKRLDRGVTEIYEWQINRIPLAEGTYGVVCYFREISEQVRARAAIAESDRRKSEFLALLAHELRNPLAPIHNALQILRNTGSRQRRRSGDEAIQSAYEMMERQVGQMVRLVDDLLDVSRISRGTIELRMGRVELASVVNQAIEAARPNCESMNHELNISLPPEPIYVNADPARLTQVVGNLLNNACKFTDKGGRIGVTLVREGEQAVIRVRDNGIGIAAGDLPRIFDMFTQIDASLRASESGLGVGLSLVKNVTEMHGGTVEGHSAGIGRGSEFAVRLPILVEPVDAPPPELAVSEPAPATARRILVVDDNRDSATSLALLLKLAGNETHTAYDGLEAVEVAAVFRPDVVLLDIGLPKLNGYEVARKLRQQPWGKNVVLVAVTGWGQKEDRQKSKEAGLEAHLVKPVDCEILMRLVAEITRGRQC